MPKTWKTAVVGTGVVGDWHVACLKLLDFTDLMAVCDVKPEQMDKSLAKHHLPDLPRYADLQQMLDAHPEIQSVHVCTPSGDHMDPVLTALNAGKNVVCEKPMEIQLDRIDRMIAAADANGVRLAGIFQNRWDDANRALKQAADEHRFGTLAYGGCYTPWFRTDQYYRDGGWRGTWKLDGGGAIMNQSVHGVDLLQWIMGPVKTVTAHASSRIHPEIEVEDTLACALTFESGAHGVLMGTTAMWPGGNVRLEVGGENGTAVSEDGLRRWTFRDQTDEDKHLPDALRARHAEKSTGGGSSPADVPQYLHLRNLTAIYQAWERGEEPETTGREARKAVAIIRAMYDSAAKGGQPVAVQ